MSLDSDFSQYNSLRCELVKTYRREFATGNYTHLRSPESRTKPANPFMNSRFKISFIPRPPLQLGNNIHSYTLPSRTEIILYLHGTFKGDSIDDGFTLENEGYRTLVRNPLKNVYPFHRELLPYLCLDEDLPEFLENADYGSFVKTTLQMAEITIELYKS